MKVNYLPASVSTRLSRAAYVAGRTGMPVSRVLEFQRGSRRETSSFDRRIGPAIRLTDRVAMDDSLTWTQRKVVIAKLVSGIKASINAAAVSARQAIDLLAEGIRSIVDMLWHFGSAIVESVQNFLSRLACSFA